MMLTLIMYVTFYFFYNNGISLMLIARAKIYNVTHMNNKNSYILYCKKCNNVIKNDSKKRLSLTVMTAIYGN